jgi:hypothetical protein
VLHFERFDDCAVHEREALKHAAVVDPSIDHTAQHQAPPKPPRQSIFGVGSRATHWLTSSEDRT